MPYAAKLHSYIKPEWFREFPESWMTRLREVSPIRADLDHLIPRWFDAHPSWVCAERGQWILYSAKPTRMVDAERAGQFDRHWSEMPELEQAGRKAVVSDYQHFMWHSQGLYVKPFLILQGEWGGTPAKYTEAEIAFLDSSDCFSEPFPIGTFPACGFDERVVKTIALRDRLLQCANDMDRLAKMDSAAGMKAEDDAALQIRRQTYLDTWNVLIQPQKEFLQHYMKRSEHREEFPDAPKDLPNKLAQWKDHFLTTGKVLGANRVAQRRVPTPFNPSFVQ